ncbi:MAG: hypothetical protein HYV90_04680 [Candidatus Woesebacteria bacterium]|nr:MAG: hypothetical protein HYV90_04680 [Candidatus Woesebacteria bacterium]
MVENPYQKNIRKHLIIENSPFLRAYIDPYGKADPEMWQNMAGKVFVSKRDEMIELLGERLISKDCRSFLYMAEQEKVFSTTTPDENKLALIFSFALMGFEVGSENDLDLFVDDIVGQVYMYNVLNQSQKTKEFVRKVMRGGVRWKEKMATDTPKVFVDFIKKLDF